MDQDLGRFGENEKISARLRSRSLSPSRRKSPSHTQPPSTTTALASPRLPTSNDIGPSDRDPSPTTKAILDIARDRIAARSGRRMSSGSVSRSLSPTSKETPASAGRRTTERTPVTSPTRKRQRVYNDRFIPARTGEDMTSAFHLLHDEGSPAVTSKVKRRAPHNDLQFQKTEQANRVYSTLLRSELDLPTTLPQHRVDSFSMGRSTRGRTPPSTVSSLPAPVLSPSTPRKNMLTFSSPKHLSAGSDPHSPSRTPSSRRSVNLDPNSAIYSVSPIKYSSQQLLLSPRKQPRVVNKVPYKVLDAPELADDFYLNLVDWGSSNILGVGLGKCVYMWNSDSGKVTKLCELDSDTVTSVNWIQKGSHLAVGTHKGYVQIWDANAGRRLRTMTGHSSRVGALAWNEHILSSGSRDRSILHRDVRVPDQYIEKLTGHKQEVCGLKWNPDDGQLASGGNDNRLLIWDGMRTEPLFRFTEHQAAVKAIAWSPHQKCLLASGGGTADRKIRFWNTMTGQMVQEVDTGSQVCNLAWSKNSNELVSTHGFSQNQIVVWKYPSMQQVVSLTGHTYRVLYLAMSPDGEVIVTGAGDETLRFWNAFKKKEKANTLGKFDHMEGIR